MGTAVVSSNMRQYLAADLGFTIAASGVYDYQQSTLDTIIAKATNRINLQLNTSYDYSYASGIFIGSDPSADIQTLIVSQAECLLLKREFNLSGRRGIRIRQDDNEVDLTGGLAPRMDYMRDICKDADDLMNAYLLRKSAEAAAGIGLIWEGTTRLFEAVDFDGTGHDTIYGPHGVN